MVSKKDKKGAAHFEMIISFVFFMGIVFFLFLFLEPYDSGRLTISALDAIEGSFEENTNTLLTSFSITSPPPNMGACIQATLNESWLKTHLDESSKLLVYSIDKTLVSSSISIDKAQGLFTLFYEPIQGEKTYDFFISKEISDQGQILTNCNLIQDANYAALDQRQVTSYGALENIKDRYETDYESLKQDFKIPQIFDFEILLEELPQLNMRRQIPDSAEVFASTKIYEVLNNQGQITIARVTFRMW